MRRDLGDIWEIIKEPLQGVALFAFLLWAVLVGFVQAGEVEECQRIAPKYEAEVEVVLWDGTRVDLLSDTHAWEVDWPQKWAEAIGQSSYYAIVTGKRAGVILLVKDINKERRYVYRCQTVCAKQGIDLRVEHVRE